MRRSQASGKPPIEEVAALRARVATLERVNRRSARRQNAEESLDKAWREWERTFDAARDSIVILDNAIDAMKGQGDFLVEATRDSDYDTLVFRDTGPGFAPEVRDRLFEPLVTTKANGTGLGLTICRQVVEKHGGTIDVEGCEERARRLGFGCRAGYVDCVRDLENIEMSRNNVTQPQERVLIVDDEENMRRTLADILEEEGFDVIGCSTASQAVEHLKNLDTGVVVLDPRLPDLNGTHLLERLAHITNNIRVIIHTAYSSYESARDALNLGAFAYVEKAGDPQELLRHVHRAFAASLRSYADQLEAAVAQRTCELRQANESLKNEIAQRQNTQKSLEKERDKAQRYLDVATVMLVAVDSEQRVGLINRKGCEILGYEEEYIVGKNWFDNFLPARIRDEARAVFETSVRGQADAHKYFESPVLTRNGQERFIAWYNTALTDNQGNFIATLSSGEDITERKKAEKELLEYQANLKAMASGILQTEDRERHRIAVRLHDDICQNLVLSKLALESSLRLVPDAKVSASLRVVCGALGEAIKQVEALTFSLSNPVLRQLGLVMALKKYLAEEIQDKHGIVFELDADETLNVPSEELKDCLFRMARELLANVVKHSRARNVKVSVHRSQDQIRIIVQDDGVGFKDSQAGAGTSPKKRFGLFSIRAQLEYWGGNFGIESEPGLGTTATIVVPLGEKAGDET